MTTEEALLQTLETNVRFVHVVEALITRIDAEVAELRDGLLGESDARSRQVGRLEARIIELENQGS